MVAAALAPTEQRSVPKLVEIDGSRMRLNLHAGQQRAWRSTKRFVCVIAGSQSGKTSFSPHWLRREMSLRGPGDYMYVTPTFPLLEIKALPEFRRLFEDHLQLGTYKASAPRRFEVSKAGEVKLFGAEQDEPTTVWFGYAADPDSLESATAKAAVLDECGQRKFRLASWEAIQRRLSLHQGRTLMTTTPYNLGWLYSEIWQPWMKSGQAHPDIDVINFESIANPAFSREEFERLKREMPQWKFDMFHRGIFTRPAGLIYGNWNDDWFIEPFPIPEHWPRWLGVDFGGVNTAGLYVAEELDVDGNRTGMLYLYREYHAGDQASADHVVSMRRGEPGRLNAYGGAPSEDQWRREFSRAGLHIVRPRIHDVEVGIDQVYKAFSQDRVRAFNTLSTFQEQVRTYSRPTDEHGNPTEGILDKEMFHVLDCARYVIPQVIAGVPKVGLY